MRTASKKARAEGAWHDVVVNVDRKKVKNNTQKVLLSLLNTTDPEGWVPRTVLRVPSVSARLRDLRKPEFGGFEVECATAAELNRCGRSEVTTKQTFYRLVPKTVTVSALSRALTKSAMKGVMPR